MKKQSDHSVQWEIQVSNRLERLEGVLARFFAAVQDKANEAGALAGLFKVLQERGNEVYRRDNNVTEKPSNHRANVND